LRGVIELSIVFTMSDTFTLFRFPLAELRNFLIMIQCSALTDPSRVENCKD